MKIVDKIDKNVNYQIVVNISDRICEKGSFTHIQFTNFDNS